MRPFFVVLAALAAAPVVLPAQGRIIEPVRCGPAESCIDPRQPQVVRTSSTVRAELVDRVLRYEVEEVFVNRGPTLGEADYLFPLPSGAAFQDLKLSINGEMVAGETLDAAEARKIYEEIVRRKRDPALVEWMGQGLLRTRIFPFNAGEERRIIVRFQAVARREGDALRIDYFRGSAHTPAAVRMSDERPQAPSGRASFTLTYPDEARYGRPYSPTHELDVRESGERVTVSVRGSARDLTVLLPVRQPREAAISLLAHAPGNEDGFALITLTPPALSATARAPRDITFVLDISGSMSGRKMEQAKAAGRQLLSTLREGDRFRIIDFATDVRTFRDGFVPATSANIAEAGDYLDDLEPRGSTNISGALEAALSERDGSDRFSVVLFVTDGMPTVGKRDASAIAAWVAQHRGGRRIFSFGLGSDVNVALIEQLALEGKGTAHFVRPDESVERTVGIVASRLVHPVATNVRVRADGVRLERLHPTGAVDLFAGEDLVLLARYDGSGAALLTVEGQSARGPVRWTQRVVFPARSRENPFIPRLWATQRVGFLAAEKRKHGGSPEIDAEIRELGERYGIPTEFTSYFVREPEDMVVVGRRDRARGEAVTLNQAPAAAASPSRAVAQTGAAAFDAAREAAEQRAVKSVAAADELDQQHLSRQRGVPVQRAGNRIFELRDGTWTDAKYKAGTRTVRIAPFSEAYFALLGILPELEPAFALGERVIVAGRSVAIELSPDGSSSLSERQLSAIRSDWQG